MNVLFVISTLISFEAYSLSSHFASNSIPNLLFRGC